MDTQTGTVTPPNLVPNKFVHYTADNIDILDETLDGKQTFHATQLAAWQRGPAPDVIFDDIKPSTKQTLVVPEAMDKLSSANMPATKVKPVCSVGYMWTNLGLRQIETQTRPRWQKQLT